MHSTKSHGKVSGGKDREPAFKEAAFQYTVLTALSVELFSKCQNTKEFTHQLSHSLMQ